MKAKTVIIIILTLGVAATCGYFVWTKWIHTGNKTVSEKTDSDIDFYHCSMHPWVTSKKPGQCPICGMNLVPVYKHPHNENADEGIIQIDPVMVQDIGVETEKIIKRKLTHTIRTSGIVDYDETKQSVITTKFSGYIEKLYANYTGMSVQQGQPLFEIYSPELVAAQQEYLQAIRYSRTMKTANDSAVSTGANDLVQSARKKLLYWDISTAQIQELEKNGSAKKTLTVYSPFSGIIAEKNISDGMQVQAGMNLLKLSNFSDMWVYADVYENELI